MEYLVCHELRIGEGVFDGFIHMPVIHMFVFYKDNNNQHLLSTVNEPGFVLYALMN